MRINNSEEIVINGVRYNVSIRLERRWSYHPEWWHNGGSRGPASDDRVRSASEAERRASDEIQKARLRKEPWLRAEIARAEDEELILAPETP